MTCQSNTQILNVPTTSTIEKQQQNTVIFSFLNQLTYIIVIFPY